MPPTESDQESRDEVQPGTMSEKSSPGVGKTYPPPPPNLESYVVDFDGPDDPTHPYNWKFSTKYDCPTQHITAQSTNTIFVNLGFFPLS